MNYEKRGFGEYFSDIPQDEDGFPEVKYVPGQQRPVEEVIKENEDYRRTCLYQMRSFS